MKPGYYQLNTDGGIDAAKGQAAGEAAIGVVLNNTDGSRLHEISMRIGRAVDHHVAEYEALIAGLKLARGHGIDRIRVSLDSQLVFNQVSGKSKVRKKHLKPLHEEARALIKGFDSSRVTWVPRAENIEADALANRALAPRRKKP